MGQSREDLSLSRFELVALACLSQTKPPSDDALAATIQEMCLPDKSVAAARAVVAETLLGLQRRGLATVKRKLTDAGTRALRSAFSLPRTPTWTQVRDKHLVALALGLAPGSDLAASACEENALVSKVLCTRFGVREAPTPGAICDALIAEALGMDLAKMPPGKMTLGLIRGHVLARCLSSAKGGTSEEAKGVLNADTAAARDKIMLGIAYGIVGARDKQRRMAKAIGRRWASNEAYPLGERIAYSVLSRPGSIASGPVPSVVEIKSGEPPKPQLVSAPSGLAKATQPIQPPTTTVSLQPADPVLQVVREALPRVGADGRFGSEKVFVSAIWRSIERDRKLSDLSLDRFKKWLVGANRDGLLVLARADLIGAMDSKQVAESEIQDRGATFHFVLDPRNGAAGSQRESHAQ